MLGRENTLTRHFFTIQCPVAARGEATSHHLKFSSGMELPTSLETQSEIEFDGVESSFELEFVIAGH